VAPIDYVWGYVLLGTAVLALIWICTLSFFTFWDAPPAVQALTRAICFWPALAAIAIALAVAFLDSTGANWALPLSCGVLVLFALVAVTASGVRALAALLVPAVP
jgi:hypothetical protein